MERAAVRGEGRAAGRRRRARSTPARRPIAVSNHGGRILDGIAATADVLPEIVDAVAGRAEVYVDGGIRSGTDVVKALALGARAVMVGRPVLWGLAVDGASGAAAVLDLLGQGVRGGDGVLRSPHGRRVDPRPRDPCGRVTAMDLGLDGKVALVTGSYRGTGAGIARVLAAEGATVLVHGLEPGQADDTARRDPRRRRHGPRGHRRHPHRAGTDGARRRRRAAWSTGSTSW